MSVKFEVVKDIRLKVVLTKQMPKCMHGMVTEDNNNVYQIILNADDSEDMRRRAFVHEALHIYEDDFQRVKTEGVQAVESRTHELTDRILKGL